MRDETFGEEGRTETESENQAWQDNHVEIVAPDDEAAIDLVMLAGDSRLDDRRSSTHDQSIRMPGKEDDDDAI